MVILISSCCVVMVLWAWVELVSGALREAVPSHAGSLSGQLFTPQPSGLEGYCRHDAGRRAGWRAGGAKLAEPKSL